MPPCGPHVRLWRQRGRILGFEYRPAPRGVARADKHVDIVEHPHIVRMRVLSAFDDLSR